MHKFSEVKVLVSNHIELLSLNDIGQVESIPETGLTLLENAKLKADFVTKKYGLNCFADDTGLLVAALNNEPGVFSARYAGPQKNDEANMQKVLKKLGDNTDRSAQFKTVFALNIAGENHYFDGTVHGEILTEKRGTNGFGYDPIFKPEGYDKTFAELPLKIKNKIGHRGMATRQLIDFLNNKRL